MNISKIFFIHICFLVSCQNLSLTLGASNYQASLSMEEHYKYKCLPVFSKQLLRENPKLHEIVGSNERDSSATFFLTCESRIFSRNFREAKIDINFENISKISNDIAQKVSALNNDEKTKIQYSILVLHENKDISYKYEFVLKNSLANKNIKIFLPSFNSVILSANIYGNVVTKNKIDEFCDLMRKKGTEVNNNKRWLINIVPRAEIMFIASAVCTKDGIIWL